MSPEKKSKITRLIFWAVFLTVFTATLYYLNYEGHRFAKEQQHMPKTKFEPRSFTPKPYPPPLPPPKSSTPSRDPVQTQIQEVTPISIIPPSASTLREEVEQNPHDAPQSLMDFAKQITTEVEKAKTSLTMARTFFDTVEDDCLKNGETTTIRFLCLRNAHIVAKYYEHEPPPGQTTDELSLRFGHILEGLEVSDPEVFQYFNMMQQLR